MGRHERLDYVAGANDYNSYNGQGQDGYYWSSDGTHWNDGGPIDVFPHNPNNGGGDPGLAIDGSGVVYYSSLFLLQQLQRRRSRAAAA